MRQAAVWVLFSTMAAGAVYAGTGKIPMPAAVSLPQPCTIFLCTAGLAFCHLVTKNRKI